MAAAWKSCSDTSRGRRWRDVRRSASFPLATPSSPPAGAAAGACGPRLSASFVGPRAFSRCCVAARGCRGIPGWWPPTLRCSVAGLANGRPLRRRWGRWDGTLRGGGTRCTTLLAPDAQRSLVIKKNRYRPPITPETISTLISPISFVFKNQSFQRFQRVFARPPRGGRYMLLGPEGRASLGWRHSIWSGELDTF